MAYGGAMRLRNTVRIRRSATVGSGGATEKILARLMADLAAEIYCL